MGFPDEGSLRLWRDTMAAVDENPTAGAPGLVDCSP